MLGFAARGTAGVVSPSRKKKKKKDLLFVARNIAGNSLEVFLKVVLKHCGPQEKNILEFEI